MTDLFSLSSPSFFFALMVRSFVFVTIALVGAWLLTRLLGSNNPAYRSTVWTTSIVLTLFFPFVALLGHFSELQLIRLPALDISRAIVAEKERSKAITKESSASSNSPSELARDANKLAVDLAKGNSGEIEARDSSTDQIEDVALTKAAADIDGQTFTGSYLKEPIGQPVGNWVFFIWGVGVVLGLFRLLVSYSRVRSLLSRTTFEQSPRLERISKAVCDSIGMPWQPKIGTSPDATSPFAVLHGFRGQVVIPDRMLNALSDNELKDVIAHEFAHLHRFDPLLGLLQAMATIVYWPHPLIHLARREFIKSREEVCDNYATRNSDCIEYAKTLLSIAARGELGTAVEGASSFSSHVLGLEERIAGLLCDKRICTTSSSAIVRASIAVTFGLLGLVVALSKMASAEQDSLRPFPWHPDRVKVVGGELGRTWGKIYDGLDVHPDGHQLVTSDELGNVYLWNANTLTLDKHFALGPGRISARYTKDGNALLAVRFDLPILWIDLKAGDYATKELKDNPFQERLFHKWIGDRESVLIGSQLWDISKSGEMQKSTSIDLRFEHNIRARSYMPSYGIRALSYDGDIIAGVREISVRDRDERGRMSSKVVDGNVIIMRGISGGDRKIFAHQFVLNHREAVQAMAFSKNNRLLAISSDNGTTTVFDITGDWPIQRAIFEQSGYVESLCFHPNGEMLAVAANDLELWALDEEHATKIASISRTRYIGGSQSIVFGPKGDALFFVDGDYCVRRWDLAPSMLDPNDNGQHRYPYSHLLSSDFTNNQILSFEHTPYDWRLEVGEAAIGEILVRDLKSPSGPAKSLFKTGPQPAWCVCMSKDKNRFAFFTRRESKTNLELWQVSDEGSEQLDRIALDADISTSSGGLAFSPDGSTLVSGAKKGAIQVWDISKGKLRRRAMVNADPQLCDIRGIVFSPEGSSFATIGFPGGVNLWRLGTQDADIEKIRMIGNSIDGVASVCYSADSKTLATGDDQGRIMLWKLDDENVSPKTFAVHHSRINSLAFRSSQSEILSSGDDGQVVLWDTKNSKASRVWRYPGPVRDARFNSTDTKIITSNANGSFYIVDR